MTDDELREKRTARIRLLESARLSIYVNGCSQQEWEDDPGVQALARKAGLSQGEIEAAGALGRTGFKNR